MLDFEQYEKNTSHLLTGKPFSGIWYTSLKKALHDAQIEGINYFCIDYASGKCAFMTTDAHAIYYVKNYLGEEYNCRIYDLKKWKVSDISGDIKIWHEIVSYPNN